MTRSRRLLLVGGGHAHVEVLRCLAAEPIEGLETVVASERSHSVYSGMVPGWVAGQYRSDEIEIDVEALAHRARARWIRSRAIGLSPGPRQIHFEDGSECEYTLASLDVGASVAGLDVPGVREHALLSRPIAELVERFALLAPDSIAVVGGGAAGIELACCLRERGRRERGHPPATSIVEAGPHILPQASASLRRAAEASLRARDVALHCGAPVVRVDAGGIELAGGSRIDARCVLWVTGASPHPWLRSSELPPDEAGFVRIGPTLEVPGCPGLFAVGDCASLPGAGKAGVYAVRQGPVLAANLHAYLRGGRLRSFAPQRDFLQLLNLGDGSAIASKWGVTARGRWAMRLKDRIDRAWLAAYRV